MLNTKMRENCCGCSACIYVCPGGCISMKRDAEGFLYAEADDSSCVKCGRCTRLCDSIQKSSEDNPLPTAYAAYSKKEDERMKSSSGGVFSLLAKNVISRGGAVFGAAFDGDLRVRHVCVECEEDISLLRGAKYVQSDVGDSYIKVKRELESGREVLFSGTPCQVAGLIGMLGKKYDNLTCVDFICHGVPSPLALEKYIDMRERKSGKSAEAIRFRDKRHGWQDYFVSVSFSDGSEYASLYKDDEYMKAFLSNLTLRPSCFACKFKSLGRVSDITLADFWGIDSVCPDMNDKKGTSLLLVHSDKGKEVLREIAPLAEMRKMDPNEAVRYNSAAIKASEKNPKRDAFMKLLSDSSFDAALRKVTPPLLVRKAKSLIKKVKRKLKK